MTALTITERRAAAPAYGRFTGLRSLFRKDTTEWMRGRRAWVVLIISASFMVLTAASGWITERIREAVPAEAAPDVPASLVPIDNLLAAVSSQVFVLAAIFAVASLLVGERVSGTLAWVASKPVSRGSIWLSKWFSATVMLAITAAIVPLVLTVAGVTAMYGAPDPAAVAVLALGMTATVAFYAALGLAAGTVLPGQPAIAAIGFMVFALVPILVSLIPLPVGPFLPTSILGWAMATAAGQSVGFVTPLAWAIGTALVVAFALRRMSRMEL